MLYSTFSWMILFKNAVSQGIEAYFIDIIVAILAFCDDVCLLSPDESELQILLNICDNYSKNWAIEYNVSKCKYMVFGSNKFNNNIFILNNLPLSYTDSIKFLGIEFNKDLNFSNFFINKFQSVSNSYFSLNSFGFKPGGINPFLQSFVYKSFCISRLLYGLEIFSLNKTTINRINVCQNNIIRYITGLSKNSHVSNTRNVLKIMNIPDLYKYMKLIFVKNVKNNSICNDIFKYMLNADFKNNTKSFIKDFISICSELNLNKQYVADNINSISKDFKEKCLDYDLDIEHELIITCLNNNHDFNMISQLNLVTYAGPLFDKNNA